MEELDPNINFLNIQKEDRQFGVGYEFALYSAKNKHWGETMSKIRALLWKTALIYVPLWIFFVSTMILLLQLIIPSVQFNWLFAFVVGTFFSFLSAYGKSRKIAEYEAKILDCKYKELVDHMVEKGWLKTPPKSSRLWA